MSSELPKRLHPLSLPFRFLSHLRGFLVPIFFVVAFSKNLDWEAWTILILIPIMIFETWHYMTMRFWITDEELIVKEGVFFKEERHIPLARVQTVDSTQNLLQRLLGVVEVTVETAGASKPEANLKVLSIQARDQLRRRIFRKPVTDDMADETLASEQPAPEATQVIFVGAMELALLGLNLWRGVAILAIGFGLAGQMNLIGDAFFGKIIKLVQQGFGSLTSGGIYVDILAQFCVAVLAILLVFGLAVASIWIKLFNFRLARHGDEFRTECGLFTRQTTTIPKGRVQFLSIQAPISLRIFKRALVKVRTAGGQVTGDNLAATRQWLTPIIKEHELSALIAEFVPGFDLGQVKWHGLSARAHRRMLIKATYVPTIICSLAAWGLGSWGLYVLPVLVPALFCISMASAHIEAGRLAWATTPGALLMRDGVFAHRIAIVPRTRVQAVSIKASPFDRRWKMARLFVDTAGASIGHSASMPYLDATIAERLSQELSNPQPS